jgi:hypothetical protein
MTRKTTKLVHNDGYAAEVEVDLIEDDGAWGPYLSVQDVEKLERVRKALGAGKIEEAASESRVFELVPVSTAAALQTSAGKALAGFGEKKQKTIV